MAPPGNGLDPAWTAKRFDAAILPQLEAHVDAQCTSQSYDLEPNLAVLKLYQFHPETLKVPVVAKILVKALMNLPETDFLACTYLIPERVLDQDPIKAIVGVAAQLERCSFREVWEVLSPLREEVLNATPGFDDAVRAFVLKTFEITYQSVPKAHLRASLGYAEADAAFVALVAKRGWTIDGDAVKIALNADNTAKPKRVDDSGPMDVSQMTKILASVAASS
jgi:translation initiation factor 3 subunit K